jgi:hypothetical protein
VLDIGATNLELARRALSAPRRSEFVELFDPTVRLDLSERVFNPELYEGYGGLTRWRADVDDVWGSYHVEPEEFFEGDDVVVVFTRERSRGKASGVEVESSDSVPVQDARGQGE